MPSGKRPFLKRLPTALPGWFSQVVWRREPSRWIAECPAAVIESRKSSWYGDASDQWPVSAPGSGTNASRSAVPWPGTVSGTVAGTRADSAPFASTVGRRCHWRRCRPLPVPKDGTATEPPMPATNTEPLWPGCPHVRPPHPPAVVHPAEVAKEQSDQPLAAAALAQRFTPTVNRPSVPVNRPSVPVPPSNHQPPWCAGPPFMYTCCTWSFIWPR